MSKAQLVLSLVGWIPTKLGTRSRNLLYRHILSSIGNDVCIDPAVKFIHSDFIEIGHQVRISSNVIVDARNSCKILIGDRAILHEAVYLRGGFGSGRICLKDQVRLDYGVYIKPEKEGNIEIGERTYLGAYTCVGGPGPIKIGRDCMIASHTGIYGNNHIFTNPKQKISEQGVTCKGIVIEDDCWLGTGVKVLDGVTVGKGCVIGAGAVVTKDIAPYSVAVGVPAKVISHRTNSSITIMKN